MYNFSTKSINQSVTTFTSPLITPGQGSRHLYTPAALGLDQYIRLREDTSIRFTNIQDGFKGRMRDLLATQDKAMIFTEDFKNVLHLAQDNEEDMAMVREMARRCVSGDGVMKWGEILGWMLG